ncbi:FAD-dependent oxidoreductase [Cellulomonas sp. SLBN-39]|uniref:FAD-dependent oxidoreductase n=1 Tax=Cellulomonas sp. SLBN-39 TaxID=2768446 RepID=UPI00114ED722|nr:FAD-dependent oxidoreductase [Cellulomonas sp. SLBN-39]TQL04622.1 NADPH-dependent 2,4-dienoyl-CoA reductase/sulfur reductase-like enzyme [Cellulomonas sp. SLBN-39]
MKIVIVGGVAAGMSAAARARRLAEDAQIVVLERGPHVSFAACGLPYHLSGEIADADDLLLHTPASLQAALGLDVRTHSEAVAIDRTARTVRVAGPQGEYDEPYDALLLAPGAVAVAPPLPGLDLPAVRTLRTVADAVALRERVDAGARRAVVLGAGFIGLEAVEALRHRGVDVDLVERAPQVLPPLDPELAALVAGELADHGVRVRAGVSATGVEEAPDGGVVVVLDDGTRLPADLVVLSVGVRPDSALAASAGLDVDARGAIVVDAAQRTSDPHVWAAGDATAVVHAVTGARGPVPLAGPANRAGRTAADSMLGAEVASPPVLGTAVVRVMGLTAAVTGANAAMLADVEHHTLHLHGGHHAGFYPGAQAVHLVVHVGTDGRLLGAQAVGREGVDKRIDVIATAIRAGLRATDLADLELAYAPPYGAAKDPVNMAGFVAQNVLDGTLALWHARDLDAVRASALVLDVRGDAEWASGHLPEALHVPHTQLRDRLDEVVAAAAGRPVRVHCASGVRSYLAHRVLVAAGLDSASLSGGMQTLRAVHPDLELVTEAQRVPQPV